MAAVRDRGYQPGHPRLGELLSEGDVRKLFHQLDGWIERWLWSFIAKRRRRFYQCIGCRVVRAKGRRGGSPASRSASFDAVTAFFERSPIGPVISSKAVNIAIFVSHRMPQSASTATVCVFLPQYLGTIG